MKEKIKQKLSCLNFKNKKVLSAIFLVALMAIVGGLSYAIWTNTYSTNINTITSGAVSMSFTETSNIITINDALPMSDTNGKVQSEYFDFSVTSNLTLNNGDAARDITYSIIIEPMNNEAGYVYNENATTSEKSQCVTFLSENYSDWFDDPENDSTSLCNGGEIWYYSLADAVNYGDFEEEDITYLTSINILIYDAGNIDEGYYALDDEDIKIYLENKDTGSALLEPTTIYDYSQIDYELYHATHTHVYGTNTVTTNYRLRAWIDEDVDASSWSSSNKYEYKFRININGNVKQATAQSCFTYSGSSSGVVITGYTCDEDSLSQTSSNGNSSSLVTTPNYVDKSNNYKSLDNQEVITDVVIPDKIVITEPFGKVVSAAANPSDDDITECAEFVLDFFDYDDDELEANKTMCRGGSNGEYTFEELIELINANSSALESWRPEVFELGVFEVSTNPAGAYNVVAIGENAFSDKGLTSVSIPNTVTSIGAYAFYHNYLSSVTIGNSVTTIESRAFYENYLTSVTIPNSVTFIGVSAFSDNKITSLTLGNSLEELDTGAFANNKITSITIPSSLTSIGSFAFQNNNLTSVVIPSTVESISYSFAENENLTSITVDDNNENYTDGNSNAIIEIDSNKLIQGCKNTVIPNTVTEILYYAFYGMGLNSITIPDSVTFIGYFAFYDNHLTSVTIPSSVTSISNSVFRSNDLTSVTIPNSVTTIDSRAFADNKLTNISLPSSLTSIGDQAFHENYLTSITIPSLVTTIGYGAFEYNKLTSLTIPNAVTKIGNEAFAFNNLSYVVINSGSSLTASTGLEKKAFSKSSTSTWGDITYVDNPNLTTIYNNSGKAFDWSNAVTGSSSSTFVTGTVTASNGTVTVTTGSPS